MIKFILAVIAMIFVGLAAYVYMNPKETDAPVAKVAQKTERSIVKKDAPSVQKESVSAKKVEVVSEKKIAEKVDGDDSNIDEFGIPHPKLIVDEEQILKEINGEATVQLDKATIQKIEAEINEEAPKLDDATIQKIEAEINEEAPKLDDATIQKIEAEITDTVFQ